MMEKLEDYRYELIKVLKFIDGDTVRALIGKDVGFGAYLTWKVKLRFVDIDCPQKGAPGFDEATEYTRQWLEQPGQVIVETFKTQSFDRWMARLTRNGEDLSQKLLEEGLAIVYKSK